MKAQDRHVNMDLQYVAISLFCIFNLELVFTQESPVVNTTYGQIRGYAYTVRGKVITSFRGIPYAKPPVGKARFKMPQPLDPWQGVYNATQFRSICFQPTSSGSTYQTILNDIHIGIKDPAGNWPMSEECLFLNIFLPGSLTEMISSPRHVMFYIHGGNLIYGCSNDFVADVLSSYGDVIVVTINYRLGILGFMSSADGIFPGNVGFFDQHLALSWVNANIAQFGGMAHSITIFGESAGGLSTLAHVVSPLSRNLFRRAIVESSIYPNAELPQTQYKQLTAVITKICPNNSTLDVLMCMQALSPRILAQVTATLSARGYISMSLDGYFIIDQPMTTLIQGEFDTGKEIMIGFLSQDGSWGVGSYLRSISMTQFVEKGINLQGAKQLIPPALVYFFNKNNIANNEIIWNLVYQKYLSCLQNHIDYATQVMNFFTDDIFSSIAYETAKQFSIHGGKAYLYQFDHVWEKNKHTNIKVKVVGHGSELAFVFGFVLQQSGFTAAEIQLSLSTMTAWTQFAKTGYPYYLDMENQTHLWNPFSVNGNEYLKFTTSMRTESLGRFPPDQIERIEFWTQMLIRLEKFNTCDPVLESCTLSDDKYRYIKYISIDHEILLDTSKGSRLFTQNNLFVLFVLVNFVMMEFQGIICR